MDIIIKFDPPNPIQVTAPNELFEKKEIFYHILLDAFLSVVNFKPSLIIKGNVIDLPVLKGEKS